MKTVTWKAGGGDVITAAQETLSLNIQSPFGTYWVVMFNGVRGNAHYTTQALAEAAIQTITGLINNVDITSY